jgi:hypothetical protein
MPERKIFLPDVAWEASATTSTAFAFDVVAYRDIQGLMRAISHNEIATSRLKLKNSWRLLVA